MWTDGVCMCACVQCAVCSEAQGVDRGGGACKMRDTGAERCAVSRSPEFSSWTSLRANQQATTGESSSRPTPLSPLSLPPSPFHSSPFSFPTSPSPFPPPRGPTHSLTPQAYLTAIPHCLIARCRSAPDVAYAIESGVRFCQKANVDVRDTLVLPQEYTDVRAREYFQ